MNAFDTYRAAYYDELGVDPPLDDEEEKKRLALDFVETVGPTLSGEFGKGLGRGVGGIIEGIGAAMRILSGDTVGQGAVELGEAIVKGFPQHPTLAGNIVDSPELLGSPHWWAGGLGSMAPMLVGGGGAAIGLRAAGAGLRTSAAAGGAFGGVTEGLPLFNELRDERDYDFAPAAGLALTNAAGVGALNALPIARALGGGSAAAKIFGTSAAEAVTEFAEAPLEALLTGDDMIQAAKEGLTAAPIAAVAGGALGGVTSLASPPQQPQRPQPLPDEGPAIDEQQAQQIDPPTEPEYQPSPFERALEGGLETGWETADNKLSYTPLKDTEFDADTATGATVADAMPYSRLLQDYPDIGKLPIVDMAADPEAQSLGGSRLTPSGIEIDRTLPVDQQRVAFKRSLRQAVGVEEGMDSPFIPNTDPIDTSAELSAPEQIIGINLRERLTPSENPEPKTFDDISLDGIPVDLFKNLSSLKRQLHSQALGTLPTEGDVKAENVDDVVQDTVEHEAKKKAIEDSTTGVVEQPQQQELFDPVKSLEATRKKIRQQNGVEELDPTFQVLGANLPPGVTEAHRGAKVRPRKKGTARKPRKTPLIGNSAAATIDPVVAATGAVGPILFSEASAVAAQVEAIQKLTSEKTTENIAVVDKKALEDIGKRLGKGDDLESFVSELQDSQLGSEAMAKAYELLNLTLHRTANAVRAYEEVQNKETKAELEKAHKGLSMTVELWDNLGTQAGRALRIRAELAKLTPDYINALSSAKGDPASLAALARRHRKAKISDVLLELWLGMGLLSNPVTQIVNVVSNAVTGWTMSAEMLLAAGLSGKDGVTWQEAAAYAGHGIFGHGTKSLAMAKNALVTGQELFDQGKIDADRFNAISSEALGITNKQMAAVVDAVGGVARVPFRLLMTADAYFKNTLYERWLRIEAVRHVQKQNPGLKGKEFKIKLGDFLANEMMDRKKHRGMHARAKQHALMGTFNQDNKKIGQAISSVAAAHPIVRVVFPFIRTPMNIISFALQRTPFGMLMAEPRAAMMGRNGKKAQAQAQARMLLGSTLMAGIGTLAAAGMISGAPPSDSEDRRLWYRNNQPYSFRFGDKWVSYGRIEPLGIIFGLAADFVHLYDYMEADEAAEFGAVMVAGVAQNFLSKTWMSGASAVVQALMEPERYGDQYISRLVASVVPAGVAQIERIEDPYLRYSQGIMETIRGRLPGASSNLPMRYDVFGQPIRLSPEYIPGMINLINPLYISQYENDTVAQEAIRLRVRVPSVPRKLGEYELTGVERMEYQKISGRLVHQQMKMVVDSAFYQHSSSYVQQQRLNKARRKARSFAQKIFLARNPQIRLAQRTLQLNTDFFEGPTRLNY